MEFSLKEKKGAAEPVPFQLAIFKGIKSHRIPRAWVRWLLTHPVPQAVASWAETSALADEMLIPTLARVSLTSQQEDGSWLVEQKGDLRDPRHLQHWAPDMSCRGGSIISFLQMIFFIFSYPGQWRHNVCVFSLEDLPSILTSGAQVGDFDFKGVWKRLPTRSGPTLTPWWLSALLRCCKREPSDEYPTLSLGRTWREVNSDAQDGCQRHLPFVCVLDHLITPDSQYLTFGAKHTS